MDVGVSLDQSSQLNEESLEVFANADIPFLLFSLPPLQLLLVVHSFGRQNGLPTFLVVLDIDLFLLFATERDDALPPLHQVAHQQDSVLEVHSVYGSLGVVLGLPDDIRQSPANVLEDDRDVLELVVAVLVLHQRNEAEVNVFDRLEGFLIVL